MSDGYESVAEALEDATGPAGGSILQRAIREANGQPAYPSPTDYVAAVTATNGAVAIVLDGPNPRVVRLEDPDERVFGVTQTDGLGVVRTPRLTALIDEHGAELALYATVAEAFDDTAADEQPTRPIDPTTGNVQ